MKPSLDPNIIDLEDIITFIKKKKQKIYSLAFITFCFGFFLALIKTPEYTVTSVFKEGGSKVDALSASMMKSIFKESSLFTNPTQALALMRSRSFCTPLVQEMGFQVNIREKNLFLEFLGRIKKRYVLCFQGSYPSHQIDAHHVNYRRVKASSILIEPLETTLKLTYENKTWEVPKEDQTIVFKDGSFDIEVSSSFKKAQRIVLMPVHKALERVQKKFKIKSRREDGSILDLSFTDDQEKRGVRFLNRLMEQYQEHLLSEQKKLARNQLAYLHLRKEQIQQDFNAALEKHAKHLEAGLSDQGFLALQQHLEHIQTQKQGNFEKEKQIQLKLSTLEQLTQERSYTFHDPFLGESCKHLQEQLFALSKERQQMPKTFMIHRPVDNNIALINQTTHPKDPQFFQILNPISRLSYQENQTYQPLNLQLAKESYKKIQERLDALDETKQGLDQAAQLLDQESATMSSIKDWIKDWEKAPLIVELSAAETLLEDPYRSLKEKEYIKKENETKRVTLKKELLKKAQVAQSKIIKLTKQQQSVKEQITHFLELEKKVIENEIEHQWQEKKELLKLEQEQIAEAQKKIQQQEQQLPQKWLQENQLRLEADLNLALMEGLSKMFESKNIEANLAYLQSEVIDPAFVSLTPKTLSAFPFGLILAAMSLVTLIGYEIARAMRKGFPLSLVGLKHRGFKVAKHQNLAELQQHLQQAQLSSSISVISIFKADFNNDIGFFLSKKWLVIEVTPVATLSFEKVLKKLCAEKASHVSLSYEEVLKWLVDPSLNEWIVAIRQIFSLICFVSDPKNGAFVTQALCRCSDQILLELGEMSVEDVEPFGQEHAEKTVIFSVTNTSIV